MNEDTEKGYSDDIENILALSNARPVPRKEMRDRAFARLHRDWMLGIRRQRRMRRLFAFGAAAAVAAIVAVTVQIGSLPVRNNESIASEILKVSGNDVRLNGVEIARYRQSQRSNFSAGDTIATGSESMVALSWHSIGSLRLNAQSEIEFLSPQSVRLHYGAVYFDSDPVNFTGTEPARISVDTPYGTVTDLGTQFMAKVSPAKIAISVREGEAHFDDPQHPRLSLSIPAGHYVEVRADSSIRRQGISPVDEQWSWVTTMAPEVEFNGRSTLDLLNWIARETGRQLRFQNALAQNLAASDRLVGVDRVGPTRALELVPLVSDLTYEIDGSVIRIGARRQSSGQ